MRNSIFHLYQVIFALYAPTNKTLIFLSACTLVCVLYNNNNNNNGFYIYSASGKATKVICKTRVIHM